MTNPTCTITGCPRPGRLKTKPSPCLTHYFRIRRTGQPGDVTIQRYGQPPPPCSVDDCSQPTKARSLCDKHLQRERRTGDPNTLTGRLTAEANHAYKGDQVGYVAAHDRVRRAHGRAAEHDCSHCGDQARHWAYDHNDPNETPGAWRNGRWLGAYSPDPAHYQALCVPCHTTFDASRTKQR